MLPTDNMPDTLAEVKLPYNSMLFADSNVLKSFGIVIFAFQIILSSLGCVCISQRRVIIST